MLDKEIPSERWRQVEEIKRLGQKLGGQGVYLKGLWACRWAASLSQRELAELIGTRQSTVQALEGCSRGAHPKTVRKLAHALDVDPVDLIADTPKTEER